LLNAIKNRKRTLDYQIDAKMCDLTDNFSLSEDLVMPELYLTAETVCKPNMRHGKGQIDIILFACSSSRKRETLQTPL
jgi:hypothetical protein